ncbi:hypothetical protein Rs2_48796 [Raphanus sativus]|nr:hypothetical protein Rs2_48796 [Raphanus sativus]
MGGSGKEKNVETSRPSDRVYGRIRVCTNRTSGRLGLTVGSNLNGHDQPEDTSCQEARVVNGCVLPRGTSRQETRVTKECKYQRGMSFQRVQVLKGYELPKGTSVQRVQVTKGCELQTVPMGHMYGSSNRSNESKGSIGYKAIQMDLGLTRLYGSMLGAGSGKEVLGLMGRTSRLAGRT